MASEQAATSPEVSADMDDALVLRASGLERRYGSRAVLWFISLRPRRGRRPARHGPERPGRRRSYGFSSVSRLRPAGRSTSRSTADVGYVGHEPILYRELTALENLDLFGRLYRVPERRERIGMLLERFGLWDVRGERVRRTPAA